MRFSPSPEVPRSVRRKMALQLLRSVRVPHSRRAYLFLLGLLAFLSGCGYFVNPDAKVPSGPGTPSQSGSVTISPTYVALSPGQKFQFTATAADGGALEWLVNGVVGGAPATGRVDTAGNYIAP